MVSKLWSVCNRTNATPWTSLRNWLDVSRAESSGSKTRTFCSAKKKATRSTRRLIRTILVFATAITRYGAALPQSGNLSSAALWKVYSCQETVPVREMIVETGILSSRLHTIGDKNISLRCKLCTKHGLLKHLTSVGYGPLAAVVQFSSGPQREVKNSIKLVDCVQQQISHWTACRNKSQVCNNVCLFMHI